MYCGPENLNDKPVKYEARELQYMRNDDDKDENWFVGSVLWSNDFNPIGSPENVPNVRVTPSWLEFHGPASKR